jgi:hypothetical protein
LTPKLRASRDASSPGTPRLWQSRSRPHHQGLSIILSHGHYITTDLAAALFYLLARLAWDRGLDLRYESRWRSSTSTLAALIAVRM